MSGAAGIFPSTVFGEGPLGPGIDAPAPLARESPFVGAISDVVENPSVRAADDTGASATSAGCVCTVAIARSRDCEAAADGVCAGWGCGVGASTGGFVTAAGVKSARLLGFAPDSAWTITGAAAARG